jgi:hypothetical protein
VTSVGRNDPCPCGSGKKYKRCCLQRAHAEDRERSAHYGAAGRALAWLEEQHGEAMREAILQEFLGAMSEQDVESLARLGDRQEMAVVNAAEWFLAEGEIEAEGEPRRPLDLVLGPGGLLLDADQRRWLEALAREPLALWEVQECEPGAGLWVKNVFDPRAEPRWVRERTASRTLRPWDLFGARAIPWQDRWELSGCIYPIERSQLPALRDEVGRALRSKAVKRNPELAPRLVGVLLRGLWLESLLAAPRGIEGLELLDAATGEALLFVTDHYRVRDWGRLAEALAAQPDVEGDRRQGWARLGELSGALRRTLLSLEAAGGDRLKAFARSRGAADAGREWFARVAGGSVEFLRRELSDPRGLLQARASERPRPAARPMTTELAQAMYDGIYHDWADQPIPALSGKTPRQAVRSKSGGEQVIDLLKTYEQGELRRAEEEKREPASLQFLWDAVGLDREASWR